MAETCGCCERQLGTIDYDTGTCACGVPLTRDLADAGDTDD